MTKVETETIRPIVRTGQFELDPALAGNWCGGSAVKTHLLNALSMFLPSGERFFVQTVGEVVSAAPRGRLGGVANIAEFLAQESMHRRQHERYNACIGTRYASVPRTQRYMDVSWKFKRAICSRNTRLALTVAIEHLTTIMARAVLAEGGPLRDSDREYASLWRWHALEELEHKSVAFDLFNATARLKWRLKLLMPLVTFIFACEFAATYAAFLRQDRLLNRASWKALRHLWRSPQARAARADYRRFYSRHFDPALVDDVGLILSGRADGILGAHVRGAAQSA